MNELTLLDQAYTGFTIYAIIGQSDQSTEKLWNQFSSSFTAPDVTNVSHFANAMVEAGMGLFSGTFPAGITQPGRYIVSFYHQAGGSPASSDVYLSTQFLDWDGGKLVTQVGLESLLLTLLSQLPSQASPTAYFTIDRRYDYLSAIGQQLTFSIPASPDLSQATLLQLVDPTNGNVLPGFTVTWVSNVNGIQTLSLQISHLASSQYAPDTYNYQLSATVGGYQLPPPVTGTIKII